MGPALPRGMRDLEPEELEGIERIRGAFRDACRLFGFRLMEPSPLELMATLEAKSGPSVRDEIYHFLDKAGRELGLRFDLTVGITRYVSSKKELAPPIKLAAFGALWRYDEPQFGRYRWFHQWDVEIFGARSAWADAEVIDFTSHLLGSLGLTKMRIEVGDRRVVNEFLERRLGIREEDQQLALLRAVDKVGRRSEEEILEECRKLGIKEGTLEHLLAFSKIRGEPFRVLETLKGEGVSPEALGGLSELAEALEAKGIKGITYNMAIVRGLDYYTGTVFEAFSDDAKEVGALAGGGRYDALPQIFGRPDLGATGAAGGVERTLLVLSRLKLKGKEVLEPAIFLAYTSEDMGKVALELAGRLRREGLPIELELSRRPLRRQLEYAASRGKRWVLLVGKREWEEGKVLLRDMEGGEERRIRVGELVGELKVLHQSG